MEPEALEVDFEEDDLDVSDEDIEKDDLDVKNEGINLPYMEWVPSDGP